MSKEVPVIDLDAAEFAKGLALANAQINSPEIEAKVAKLQDYPQELRTLVESIALHSTLAMFLTTSQQVRGILLDFWLEGKEYDSVIEHGSYIFGGLSAEKQQAFKEILQGDAFRQYCEENKVAESELRDLLKTAGVPDWRAES